MKNVLIILSAVLFVACSNEDENIIDKQYELFSMEWRLEEGDGEEVIEKKINDRVYTNVDNKTILVTISSRDEMDETSHFSSDHPNAFPDSPSGIVEVPVTNYVHIFSETYGNLNSNMTAPYQDGKVILEPNTVATRTINLSPNCKLIIKETMRIRKATASYRAYFKEINGHGGYEVTGKWTGEFYDGSSSEYHFTEIE